ncbi:hypothetical protein HNE05_01625 [Aquipseudomonas campi]|uniref:Uncharacterized protein n=1 Tax=Aquipseudomonas campi TaxID=2731681 RepID=A0A6M8F1A4_9GAMM|nr:hypothetical protein [Pseudomonas campi]QKE62124.1 hypothetical protein HNE05_01625 [Pseudomonas campi]
MSRMLDKSQLRKVYRHPKPASRSTETWCSLVLIFGFTFACVAKLGFPGSLFAAVVFALAALLVGLWVTAPDGRAKSGDPHVEFRQDGVNVSRRFDNQAVWEERIRRARVTSVAPYVQTGWLFPRDHGLVIENSDGVQWRIALRVPRAELEVQLESLQSTLQKWGYPLAPLRRFQP